MKAVVFHEHGDVNVLRYEEVPTPVPGPGEVLIRVRAVAMNYNDIWARRGLPGFKFQFPHMSGTDAAGEVAALGAGVTEFAVGDRVLVHPGLSCRKCAACTSGQEYFCEEFRIWGFQTGPLQGGYAEYAVLPEANLIHLADSLPFEQAAALPGCMGTAWHMLVDRAHIRPGESVLVWGATSGLGVMAVQIAKLFQASVIAVAGSAEKTEAARQLGADYVINYKTEDVGETLREITEGRGVDLVFEHTGTDTWSTSIHWMAPGARVVTCGNTTGYAGKLDLSRVCGRSLNVLGCHAFTKAQVMKPLKLVESGQMRAVIDDVLPLSRAPEAHRRFEAGQKIGKIILVP